MAKKIKNNENDQEKKPVVYGDPEYSAGDDIYSRDEKVGLDEDEDKPKRTSKNKPIGDDLDVPGSELDDADEEVGDEDEENNYYSLGGDDHDDLEEDKGE